MASQNSSDEPSGETSGHHTQESLETIVAEQYSVGSVKHTLDLRRRRLSSRDLATLQVLWPPGVQVLNLRLTLWCVTVLLIYCRGEKNFFSSFSHSTLPSSLRILKLGHNRVSNLGLFKFPPHLEILDLSHNMLYSIAVSSLDLPSLSELNVECNRIRASNAVDVLLQCAAFCTSLQSLRLGANMFTEAELREELLKCGLPLDADLKQDEGPLRCLAYIETKQHREHGRNACRIVKKIQQSAYEKNRTLPFAHTAPGDLSSLFVPERVEFHVQSMLKMPVAVSPSHSSLPSGNAALVQCLNLSACNMGSSSHLALIGLLQRLSGLRELNLSLNCFPGASVLAVLRESPSSLQTLIIRNAGISGTGLHAAESLPMLKFPSINHVDLSDNTELDAAGLSCLLDLCSTECLMSLRASNCGINLCNAENSHGLDSVLSMLRAATSLQILDLSRNPLGLAAVDGVVRSLIPDLEKLECCNLSNIFPQISSNRALRHGSWVSPLKYMNLSSTACDEVEPSLMHHFNTWFNSILAHFSNLTHLYLSENHCLINLNSNISCLDKLEFIDLSECKNLVSIPDELILARRPVSLLGCVALQYPPKEIAFRGSDAMYRFFQDIEKEKEQLKNAKVVVLGNGGTGKRSLLRALAKVDGSSYKSFEDTNKLIHDHFRSGRNFFQRVSESTPKLSFWSFGGHLEYYPHLSLHMASRQCVYIIVFSVLDSREVLVHQISHWLRAIFDSSRSQQSIRVFLVGSHMDKIAPNLIDNRKKTIRDAIEKIIGAINVFPRFEPKQISYDWWFSADPRFSGYKNVDGQMIDSHNDVVGRITTSIFEASAALFGGPDVFLFPRMYIRMMGEVKRLAEKCQGSKKFPLIKLADLSGEEFFDVKLEFLLSSHHNLHKLEAIKLLSEVGILLWYHDSQGEPWICVNLNFCVDFVMLFTNHVLALTSQPTFGNESVLSKDALYRMFQQFFQSDVTSVSWYSPSLQRHLESLLRFLVAHGLIIPVSDRKFRRESVVSLQTESSFGAVSDETFYMIPLLNKQKPKSWRDLLRFDFEHSTGDRAISISWGLGNPIKIKGSRYSAVTTGSESLITVPSFSKLMLEKCDDSRAMWGFSFLYHVDGTSLYVRLAKDRCSIDIILVGPDAPISAAVTLEMDNIALRLGLLLRSHLCPLCCSSDDYVNPADDENPPKTEASFTGSRVRTASARFYPQEQLRHYQAVGQLAICHNGHQLQVSDVEQGFAVQMPATLDPVRSFFPEAGRSISEMRKTVLWLDNEHHKDDNESIRRRLIGYVGIADSPDGSSRLQFDYSRFEHSSSPSEHEMDVICFTSVEAIKAFMLLPESLKFANFPPSKFSIISNRRLFVGHQGLCAFLDDATTPWAFSFPSIMIFYGGNPEGLEVLDGRPNATKSIFVDDCVAFITFGHLIPSFNSL